jgi:WD40 repeat protein
LKGQQHPLHGLHCKQQQQQTMKPSSITLNTPPGEYLLELRTPKRSPTLLNVTCMFSDATLRVVDLASGQVIGPLSSVSPNSSLDSRPRYTGISSPEHGLNIFASSSNSHVYAWDLRTAQTTLMPTQIFTLEGEIAELADVDVGLNGTLVCSCTANEYNSRIVFWDVRNPSKELGSYGESHSDSLTRVRFADPFGSRLISGGSDGVVCQFDVTQPNETAALRATLNAEASVAKLGCFGPNADGLWCTTSAESVSFFDLPSCTRISHYDNEPLSSQPNLRTMLEIDYIVDVLYEPLRQKLVFLGGKEDGSAKGFLVDLDGFKLLGPMDGGHGEIIRCADSLATHLGWTILTGGEDGRMTIWTPQDGGPATSTTASSSASSSASTTGAFMGGGGAMTGR